MNTCEQHGVDAVMVFRNNINGCPACKEVERGDELEKEVGGLESQVQDLEVEVSLEVDKRGELEDLVAELRAEIAELKLEAGRT